MGRQRFTGDKRDDDDLFLDELEGGRREEGDSSEFASLLKQAGGGRFASLSVGERCEARVVSIGRESIFCDIGRRSEAIIGLEEFNDEEKKSLKSGDILSLYVVKMSGSEILLSKALQGRELDHIALEEAYATGLPVRGKVTGENKGGFDVDIPGGRGFVPFSFMEAGPKQPASNYIGQTLEFRITRLHGRDVVLSRAALQREVAELERESILAELTPEQIREGTIVKIEKFGIFVDIGGGLTGLVPVSECSWSRRDDPKESFQTGQRVKVKVLKVEPTKEKVRILLSLKQTGETPWETMAGSVKVGDIVSAYVTRLMTFGAFLEVLPGLEGLVHISEMSATRRVHTPGQIVKIGDTVRVKVLSVDPENQRISLSLKAIEEESLVKSRAEEHVSRLAQKAPEDELKITGVELITKGALGTLGEAFAKAAQGPSKKRR